MGVGCQAISLIICLVLITTDCCISKLSTTLSVQLKIHYPQALSMFLRGDPNVVLNPLSWDKGLYVKQDAQEIYVYSILLNYTSSSIGKALNVKPLIDDQTWCVGANDIIVLPDHSGEMIDIYPWFHSDQGKVERTFNIYSPQLNNSRNLWVYLPPSFYENTLKPYNNILVMHDGQNLFDPNTAFGHNAWMCQDTINENIVEGEMEEIVVIGVDNTEDRINELTYSFDPGYKTGGKGDLYLNFIEQTVIPLIVSKYSPWRIKINRERMGILGSSLGGLISCYAGWTRPQTYGRLGCMSSSFWWNNQDFNNVILNPKKYPVPPNQVIYLDSGDTGVEDDDVVETKAVKDHLATIKPYVLGENLFYYLDHGAQHSETYWRQRFYVPMRALYPIRPVNN